MVKREFCGNVVEGRSSKNGGVACEEKVMEGIVRMLLTRAGWFELSRRKSLM